MTLRDAGQMTSAILDAGCSMLDTGIEDARSMMQDKGNKMHETGIRILISFP